MGALFRAVFKILVKLYPFLAEKIWPVVREPVLKWLAVPRNMILAGVLALVFLVTYCMYAV